MRYNATEAYEKVIKKAETEKLNVHDLTDALLQALQVAINLWTLFAKKILPRRKRGEKRPDAPPLTSKQTNGGGSIRVIGFDPGYYNMGVCMIDLVGMQMPPEDAEFPDEPEPLFKILLWQLVDCRQDYNKSRGYAKIHYVPSDPTAVLVPDYDQVDIRSFFFDLKARSKEKRAATLAEKKKKQEKETITLFDEKNQKEEEEEELPRSKVKASKTPRGKKRAREEEEEDDDAAPEPTPKKRRVLTINRKKRARDDESGAVSSVEIFDEDEESPKKKARIEVINLVDDA